jgi:hypothetical protein
MKAFKKHLTFKNPWYNTVYLIYILENSGNFRMQNNKSSIQSCLIQQPSVFGVDL